MGEVELPVLDAETDVSVAIDTMKRKHTAAVVLADRDGTHSLVFGGALLRARREGITALREVERRPLSPAAEEEAEAERPVLGYGPGAGTMYLLESAVRGKGVTRGPGPRESQSYALGSVSKGVAKIVTAHETQAQALNGPDAFECSEVSLHTFPDPPPDVRDGAECPKCKADPAQSPIGVVRLVAW